MKQGNNKVVEEVLEEIINIHWKNIVKKGWDKSITYEEVRKSKEKDDLKEAIILAYNLGYKSGAEDGALGLVGKKALKTTKENDK